MKFRDQKKYKDRIAQAQKATGEDDALIVIEGMLKSRPLVSVAFEFAFMGGSMGTVVGEKFVRAAELCLEKSIPLVCFSASGGARMQEALLSLMQMAGPLPYSKKCVNEETSHFGINRPRLRYVGFLCDAW